VTKKYRWKTGVPDNYVHVINEVFSGGEYTLCGDSFDYDEDQAGVEHMKGGLVLTNKKISCPQCIRMIEYCKSIKL